MWNPLSQFMNDDAQAVFARPTIFWKSAECKALAAEASTPALPVGVSMNSIGALVPDAHHAKFMAFLTGVYEACKADLSLTYASASYDGSSLEWPCGYVAYPTPTGYTGYLAGIDETYITTYHEGNWQTWQNTPPTDWCAYLNSAEGYANAALVRYVPVQQTFSRIPIAAFPTIAPSFGLVGVPPETLTEIITVFHNQSLFLNAVSAMERSKYTYCNDHPTTVYLDSATMTNIVSATPSEYHPFLTAFNSLGGGVTQYRNLVKTLYMDQLSDASCSIIQEALTSLQYVVSKNIGQYCINADAEGIPRSFSDARASGFHFQKWFPYSPRGSSGTFQGITYSECTTDNTNVYRPPLLSTVIDWPNKYVSLDQLRAIARTTGECAA
jgi:hypothetical protein